MNAELTILETQNKTSLSRDIPEFLLVIGLAFLGIFYLPKFLTYTIFVIFFILAWRTKRDYFWFAVCLVFFANPADFFNQGASDAQYRLPLFTFAQGLSFNVTDSFLIIFFLKAIFKSPPYPILIRPVFYIFFFLMFIGILMAMFYGTDMDILVMNLRIYFTVTAVYSFIRLVRNRENIYRFFILISLLMPLVLLEQILNNNDSSVLSELGKSNVLKFMIFEDTEAKRLTMKGVLINFFCIFLPFAFLKYNRVAAIWFYFIILIVVISNFLSATRFWIYSLTGFIALLTLFSFRNISFSFRMLTISGLIIIVALQVEIPSEQFQAILNRIVPAAGSLIEGNIEEVDSGLTRLEKIKTYKAKIDESKIIGYGFSSGNFNDNDLGFWNTLIAFGWVGVTGYSVMLLYIIYIITGTLKSSICTAESKNLLVVLLLGWLIIVLGYLTVWDFFHVGADRLFAAVCLMGMIHIVVVETRLMSINFLKNTINGI